ncbi:hypothetical protein [Nonomuraea sp. C10]|uniref:hypothetical protein n=1 Tax=Nonomuraea sp. C10 TaxID=2600577 RepID=UPI0011CEB623|nr:hypothetical protein [Nonomuraea sp. C10]TXK42485.1 hypothetical protein FR742_25565 [Nonomuraea sp. C10]
MPKNCKNRAIKVFTALLASVGLVYLGVTVLVRGTDAADEVAGVIGGFVVLLTMLGLLRARGEPPPRRGKAARGARPEAVAGPPVSLTNTGAHALMTALGLPARPSCDRQSGGPECGRLVNARPFAAPAEHAAGPCAGKAGRPVVVVVLNRAEPRL